MTPKLSTLLLAALVATPAAAADYIYRGQISEHGEPADGRFDLRLTLYPDAKSAIPLDASSEALSVQVSEGRFAVPLVLPELAARMNSAWLGVEVKPTGQIHWDPIPGREPVALKAGTCPTEWSLQGNAGTDATLDFLGTTDAQALVLRTSNTRAARFERATAPAAGTQETSTNVLMGDPLNVIEAGVVGATISGGGGVTLEGAFTPKPNRVSGRFGTVGGGMGNTANSRAVVAGGLSNGATFDASVGGGIFNSASGSGATIAGGSFNSATASGATIGGGNSNFAIGAHSTVAGGNANQARGLRSTVPGGHGSVAGGDFSMAVGRAAVVRYRDGAEVRGTGEPETCDDVAGAETCGDEGTYLFADARNRAIVSQGPNQFLIRAEGGVGIQPGSAGVGDEVANVPDALLHVFDGSAGDISVPASGTVAVFESDAAAFLRLLAPDAQERGVLFGDPVGGSADGGIVYTGANSLQFRTNGNATRMTLAADGALAVNNDLSVGDALAVGGAASMNGPLRLSNLGSAGTTAICRNATNQIASCSSSARYKQDIATLELGLDAVLALRPVAYRWREDGAADVGFVAEDVARIDGRLVTRDAQGQIEGVKYDRLSALLAAALQETWLQSQQQAKELQALRAGQVRLDAELATMRAAVARLAAAAE